MELFYSKYVLQKKSRLNAKDVSALQPGALLRVAEGGSWGVADIAPLPELGDQSLEQELKTRGPLFLRAFELALEDRLARKNGVSLLKDQPVRNNYLITNYLAADFNLEVFRGQTVKIKGDSDVQALALVLNRVQVPVKLRLDFNSILLPAEFEQFLSLLTPATLEKIDYIEDPSPLSNHWKNWNLVVPLAFDFQPGEYEPEFAAFRIIKPTRQRLQPDLQNYTLTSAANHSVGLAHGLRLAQNHAKNDSGFLTLDLFAEDLFSAAFVQQENMMNFSEKALAEAGIGMTAELEQQIWTPL